MPLYLSDIKIVDLNRSEIDEEKSDRKKGKFKFKKKVYFKQSDYLDGAVRPQHIIKHVGYEGENAVSSFMTYQRLWQAELLTTDDPYWPEPLPADANGHYPFQDGIFVKIPIEVWVEKHHEDIKRYDEGHKLVDRRFESEKRAMQAQLRDGDL